MQDNFWEMGDLTPLVTHYKWKVFPAPSEPQAVEFRFMTKH